MLILASKSPRRAEILRLLGYKFGTDSADTDESLPQNIEPEQAVTLLAERKALAVLRRHSEDIILGSDTVVELDGRILGKPRDASDAAAMLRSLSGRIHRVHTGVCLISSGKKHCFCSTAKVEFYPLDDRLIERYTATREPLDKAGAYGIQGRGSVLVRRIDGDFFTVMGLPAGETFRALDKFGIQPCE
jgi:septum formation protein